MAAAGSGNTTNPISVLAALNIASTDVSGGFVAYLSTLYRECDMAADKKLVQDLEPLCGSWKAIKRAASSRRCKSIRSAARSSRRRTRRLDRYQFVTNALDQFKLVLGLPANMPLILDDTAARPMTRQFDRYYEVIDDADAAGRLIEKQEDLPPEKLRSSCSMCLPRMPWFTAPSSPKMPASWDAWSKTNDAGLRTRMAKMAEERRELLDLKTDLETKKQPWPEKEERRVAELEFEIDLGGLEMAIRRYETRPWEKLAQKENARQERIKLFRGLTHSAGFVRYGPATNALTKSAEFGPHPHVRGGPQHGHRRRGCRPAAGGPDCPVQSLGPHERPGPGGGRLAQVRCRPMR